VYFKAKGFGWCKTAFHVHCRHGAQEKVFRLEYVSNQDFTDSEFLQWRQTCALQGISMPTHDELDQKLKDIKEAMIYEFKEEDIEQVGVLTMLPFHNLHKGWYDDRDRGLVGCDALCVVRWASVFWRNVVPRSWW
jgi:hypothetical protein